MRYLCLLLSVPGLLVIFLPFTEWFGPVIPLEQLQDVVRIGQLFSFPWTLAAGSLLAIPIALWHVRSLFGAGPSEALLWLAMPIALVLINVAWLVRFLLERRPFRVAAERFLVLGYLPNATLALLIFYEALRFGAAMAGIACACYLAMAVFLSADQKPGSEDVGAHA